MLPQTQSLLQEDKYHISGDIVYVDDRVRVLNHYDTFGIFDRWGDIHPHAKKLHGIYHQGTRFINKMELHINGHRPLLLSSSIKEDNQMLSVDLSNPVFRDCNIEEHTVHISRSQFVRNGIFYEEVLFSNFGPEDCSLDVTFTFSGDFKDIFEVRGIERKVQPNKYDLRHENDIMVLDYLGLDNVRRRAEIRFETPGFSFKRNVVYYKLDLYPRQVQLIRYAIHFNAEEHEREQSGYAEIRKAMQHEQKTSRTVFAQVVTSNAQFNHWLERSKADLVSLLSQTRHGRYPYAGVPWYNTAFGRDGIITAMETLWIAPSISRDVLRFLSAMQATDLVPEKDAEPGKILHETRSGEMANTGEIPFSQYYGTIDATPLFVMLAGMYYERTGDSETIRELWPNIQRALEWIDRYGDIDGDGFVEYQHKADNGLTNQGWKDSFDSVMYENGELCTPPIALCEVQGYVYGAKKYAALLADEFGTAVDAEKLRLEAAQLKQRFDEKFWDQELGCYVLALDGNKKPCRVISSNAGQCFFTGIVEQDKARMLCDTMMHESMFSGWGIRTLAAAEKRYNPMSYHNGSIWPHDNALIAYGMSMYGFQKEAQVLMNSLFDAALFIEGTRLPELYCGFARKPDEGPTAYPVACSPQAWSVAVVFMMVQACLHIQINALTKTITMWRPELPAYLQHLHISNLDIGGFTAAFEAFRYENDVAINFDMKPEGWEILIRK